jgi:hypothetical protein
LKLGAESGFLAPHFFNYADEKVDLRDSAFVETKKP